MTPPFFHGCQSTLPSAWLLPPYTINTTARCVATPPLSIASLMLVFLVQSDHLPLFAPPPLFLSFYIYSAAIAAVNGKGGNPNSRETEECLSCIASGSSTVCICATLFVCVLFAYKQHSLLLRRVACISTQSYVFMFVCIYIYICTLY